MTPYKRKAQCGDYQQQDTCVPKVKKCQWHFDSVSGEEKTTMKTNK